jgi:hypothetical protein
MFIYENNVLLIEKEVENEKDFWKAFKNAKSVVYDFAADVIEVYANDGEYEYLSAKEFVLRLIEPKPGNDIVTPLNVLFGLKFVTTEFTIKGWKKYITAEYLNDLLAASHEWYLDLKRE